MSNIKTDTINENFPVAGRDNDTQTFRDNFNNIKIALGVAKTELTELQGTGIDTLSGAARRDSDNDFNGYEISKAVLRNVTEKLVPASSEYTAPGDLTIEFQSGSYQAFKLGNNYSCTFSQFPDAGASVGKVTLELYSNEDLDPATPRKVTFSLSGTDATAFKKSGFPVLLASGSHDLEVSSSTNPVIIEIWRHSTGNFYVKYLGLFE